MFGSLIFKLKNWDATEYVLPSIGQNWIHISVLPVYVQGNTRDTFIHTQHAFHLSAQKQFLINVHFDLEHKRLNQKRS